MWLKGYTFTHLRGMRGLCVWPPTRRRVVWHYNLFKALSSPSFPLSVHTEQLYYIIWRWFPPDRHQLSLRSQRRAVPATRLTASLTASYASQIDCRHKKNFLPRIYGQKQSRERNQSMQKGIPKTPACVVLSTDKSREKRRRSWGYRENSVVGEEH